jgi:hypothetical protein
MQGRRPEAFTLEKLVKEATGDASQRNRLILAHLADEITRTGHRPEDFSVGLALPEGAREGSELALARHPKLRDLLRLALEVPELLTTLESLAELAGAHLRRNGRAACGEAGDADTPVKTKAKRARKK